MKLWSRIVAASVMVVCLAASALRGQEPAPDASTAKPAPGAITQESTALPDEAGLVRISKTDSVWIHPQRKLVVVDGEIAFRDGFLELFACPKGTKEHESLIAVDSKAYVVHAALLAVGAVPGRPVQFAPEYRAAEGPVVDVHILWRDDKGEKHTARAQTWIRNTKSQKEMEQDWVFAGSDFWVDEETGKKHYYAEEGDLICLSNFATAMMDLPIESTQSNDQLLFESFTERVPPKGTKVRLVLIPRPAKKPQAQPAEKPAAEKPAAEKPAPAAKDAAPSAS